MIMLISLKGFLTKPEFELSTLSSLYRDVSTFPVYRFVSTLSGLQEKCYFVWAETLTVILKQFCNWPQCPFTAIIDFPKCASYFAHDT